ncbi:MAG: DUF5615 family PIN-like protein [Planctomycetota bacterium]|nr:DUF5615 family PIN-like protein [Planctomycetota bacterium]
MLTLLSDENLNGGLLHAILHAQAELDLVRVQDVGLSGAADSEILEWAAAENRILLSHDKETLIGEALGRLEAGLFMPGLFIVRQPYRIAMVRDDVLVICSCSTQAEWVGCVYYLPFSKSVP